MIATQTGLSVIVCHYPPYGTRSNIDYLAMYTGPWKELFFQIIKLFKN